jgi:hypothetical protein
MATPRRSLNIAVNVRCQYYGQTIEKHESKPMSFPKQGFEPKPNGEMPLPSVSANTLARCLGVTPKVVYDLAKAGIIERGAGRLYPLEDSVRRYCDHLRRQQTASGKPSGY